MEPTMTNKAAITKTVDAHRGYAAALPHIRAAIKAYDDAIAHRPEPTPSPSPDAELLARAIDTLAAGRHLIGKYAPDHHWLAEHDARIAELKARLEALSTPSDPEMMRTVRDILSDHLPDGTDFDEAATALTAALAVCNHAGGLTPETIEAAVERAESLIDDHEQGQIAERRAEYGPRFRSDQLAAIQATHRQQRAGVKILANALTALNLQSIPGEGISG